MLWYSKTQENCFFTLLHYNVNFKEIAIIFNILPAATIGNIQDKLLINYLTNKLRVVVHKYLQKAYHSKNFKIWG